GRGVTLSAATLATALTGSAVQAAPAALAGAISTAIISGAAVAAAGSTLTLLNLMSITKLKAGLLAAAVVVGAGTPVVVQQQTVSRLRAENQELRAHSQPSEPHFEGNQLAGLRADADELERLRKDVAELHRLRAEVAKLRREKEDEARLEAENTSLNEHLKALMARTTVPEIQFHELRIEQSVTIKAKTYGDSQSIDRLIESISTYPPFAGKLRRDQPVLLRDVQARQIDSSDPGRSFVFFTIECFFADRLIKDE
ncbi:MAG TPA: hypothetical protein VJW76_12450, partial [Verrucomicrobiae bacterium]|nr:hypothetical protein [Verrucomicrobiae bacterium]